MGSVVLYVAHSTEFLRCPFYASEGIQGLTSTRSAYQVQSPSNLLRQVFDRHTLLFPQTMRQLAPGRIAGRVHE